MKTNVIIPILVWALTGLGNPVFPIDLLVPSQYGTIQGAIDASSNGDRVIVSPGIYY